MRIGHNHDFQFYQRDTKNTEGGHKTIKHNKQGTLVFLMDDATCCEMSLFIWYFIQGPEVSKS